MKFYRRRRLVRSVTRLARWTFFVSLVLLAVRLVWGWEASARMAAVQREFEGANVHGPDGNVQPLADEKNAAVLLTRAIRALHPDGLEPPFRGDGRMFGFGRGFGVPLDLAQMRSVVAANSEAIQWIDKAAALPEAQWPSVTWTPFNGPTTALESNYQLRSLLRNGAEMSHLQHDDLAAIDYLRRFMEVARIVDASPDLASHAAAAGMRSEAALAIERWDLGAGFAGSAAGRSLVKLLVDNQTSTESVARSFDAEIAAYARWTVETVPSLRGWWLRPLAVDAFARRLALQMKLEPLVRAKNVQALLAVHGPAPAQGKNLDAVVAAFSEPRLEIVDTMRLYFRSLTDMRASSILLASKLYQADTGALPSQLEQLVPNYLAALPVDPYDAEGQPMRYRADPDGPSVWSVGENGKDDKGMPGPIGFVGPGIGRRYFQVDIVYGAAWRASVAASLAR